MIASFEDGSPAVTVNKYGKGTAIAVLPDAWTAAHKMRLLILDTFDYARSLRGGASLVDIVGTNENTDISALRTDIGFRVAIVNHNSSNLPIVLTPNQRVPTKGSWTDLVNYKAIETTTDDSLKLMVPARSFRAVEFRKRQ